MADPDDGAPEFERHRDLLRSVAYRVLGRVTDTDDVVQEAWLRWSNANTDEVVDPRAYLIRVTTRLSIDRLRQLKALRESYVGPWLPEPLATTQDTSEEVEVAESVSMALLIVLETLSPLERAVFVLREAFDYPYAEIAEILDREEPAVRQLARRARDHVHERRPRFEADRRTRRRVTERFLAAANSGDMDRLLGVLAPDVVLVADGGGVVRAPRRAVRGAAQVARVLRGSWAYQVPDRDIFVADLNGAPAIVVTSAGSPVAAMSVEVGDGVVHALHLVSNPDKLVGVGMSRRSGPDPS